MIITRITVGRTYNTGDYTSRRFEATADLQEGELFPDALKQLDADLHAAAWLVLHPQRSGPVTDEDETEIPF